MTWLVAHQHCLASLLLSMGLLVAWLLECWS